MIRNWIKKLEIKILENHLSNSTTSNHYWLRNKINAHIDVAEESYLNKVILPKAILDFIKEDIKEVILWQETYCTYVKDHYVVWIFTHRPGNIIGKGGGRIDRLRDHLWDRIGTNTEIRIVEMTYGILKEIQMLDET